VSAPETIDLHPFGEKWRLPSAEDRLLASPSLPCHAIFESPPCGGFSRRLLSTRELAALQGFPIDGGEK